MPRNSFMKDLWITTKRSYTSKSTIATLAVTTIVSLGMMILSTYMIRESGMEIDEAFNS